MAGRILWDVDTQVDFVHQGGKLAVPGAPEAVPAMARLVAAYAGWPTVITVGSLLL